MIIRKFDIQYNIWDNFPSMCIYIQNWMSSSSSLRRHTHASHIFNINTYMYLSLLVYQIQKKTAIFKLIEFVEKLAYMWHSCDTHTHTCMNILIKNWNLSHHHHPHTPFFVCVCMCVYDTIIVNITTIWCFYSK